MKIDLTSCSNRFVSGLTQMLTWATKEGHLDEAERLLVALHLMRPDFVEFYTYDAWILIQRDCHADAAQLLRRLEGRDLEASFRSYAAALLAICLAVLGDPTWRAYANDVLTRNDDPDSVELMRMLTGETKAPPEVDDSKEVSGDAVVSPDALRGLRA